MRSAWILVGIVVGAGCGRRFEDPHAQPLLPLRDGHDLPCDACHTNGDFGSLSSACASCHEDDRPPGHFEGQDCGACHRATTWADADFDHDAFFPTPHHGISDCEACHLGGDTTDFSCVDCHTHSRAETDPRHHEVGGYRYDSDACYDCHRRGEGEDD